MAGSRSQAPLLVPVWAAAVWVAAPPVASAQEPAASGVDGPESAAPAEPEAEAPADRQGAQEAPMHERVGMAYYEGGRFAEGARELTRAHELSGEPRLLLHIYRAWRDAGELDLAIEALRRYLREAEEIADRAGLERRLSSMERLRQRRQQEPASPTTEPEPAAPEAAATSGEPEAVPEGPTVKTQRRGRPRDGPAQDVKPPRRSHPTPWVVMAAGGLLLVSAAVTGTLALHDERDLEDACTPRDGGGRMCPPGYASTTEHGESLATATDVLLVSGLFAVAAGVALWFFLERRQARRRPARRFGACDGGTCGWSVAF